MIPSDFNAYYDSIRDRAKDPELCRMLWDAGRAALEAELRKQEPVAAQHRFRHPQKTMPDWGPWQPCGVDMRRGNWSIDSMGYEVEYRNLYAAPVPPPDVRELVEVLRGMMDAYMDLCDESEPNYHSFQFRQERWEAARAALAKFRGQP